MALHAYNCGYAILEKMWTGTAERAGDVGLVREVLTDSTFLTFMVVYFS